MILADTNVIIRLWKNPDGIEKNIFDKEKICICGVVRSELLHGALSEENLNNISRKLDMLTEINVSDDQWDQFGRFLYRLRMGGLNLPYPDALIAFIAIQNNCPVWTGDKHFKLIKEIEPSLVLYKPEIE